MPPNNQNSYYDQQYSANYISLNSTPDYNHGQTCDFSAPNYTTGSSSHYQYSPNLPTYNNYNSQASSTLQVPSSSLQRRMSYINMPDDGSQSPRFMVRDEGSYANNGFLNKIKTEKPSPNPSMISPISSNKSSMFGSAEKQSLVHQNTSEHVQELDNMCQLSETKSVDSGASSEYFMQNLSTFFKINLYFSI